MSKLGSIFRPGGSATSLCPSTAETLSPKWSASTRQSWAKAASCTSGQVASVPVASASMPMEWLLPHDGFCTVPAWLQRPAAIT